MKTEYQLIEALLDRVSIPAVALDEPAPTGDDLKKIMQAAVTAPDHGQLRPWRFIVIEGDARRELGMVFAEALKAESADIEDSALEAVRQKPLRAPLMIVVVAVLQKAHKIPVHEQRYSAAAAAQNILLAAQALQYGAIWVTGRPATQQAVLQSLGLADNEEIIGFINIGTPRDKVLAARKKSTKRPAVEDHVFVWKGYNKQ